MEKEWRTWLASLPSDEKRKLMEDLKISQSSLSRWISRERTPRPHRLYDLINFYPALRASIEQEFPDAFTYDKENIALHLPVQQYEEILQTFAIVAESVSHREIAQKVFVHMSESLDPISSGLFLLPSFCVPVAGIISHLRTADGYGTGIWKRTQEHEYFDLGKDSLAGVSVTRCRTILYPQMAFIDHRPFSPHAEKVESAAAFPLLRRGNIAGALVVASVHGDFFNERRCDQCIKYTNLYALSLLDEQFYSPQRIALRVMREGIDQPETNGASH